MNPLRCVALVVLAQVAIVAGCWLLAGCAVAHTPDERRAIDLTAQEWRDPLGSVEGRAKAGL